MRPPTRADCLDRDTTDPLAPMREHFDLREADAAGLIYLDGNSLGVLPKATPARVRRVVEDEWGGGLIRSWNTAGWISLSKRVGGKIAPLIGAAPDEVLAVDSTSVNLYKVLSVALELSRRVDASRRIVVAERQDFPTDLYIAQSVCASLGFDLRLVEVEDITTALDETVALLLLTQVNYRTGRIHPMSDTNRDAHRAGALVVWDLSHSAGVMPIDVNDAAGASDFAVGCGYKFLNGGPGAPAFVWVHARHLDRMDDERLRQPLSGWLGHANAFDFSHEYEPGPGIARFICGTPPILSLVALECGVDVFAAAEERGGMKALRSKSTELTEMFIELVERGCPDAGLSLTSPRDPAFRGAQVCFTHDAGAYGLVQALCARGVIGDFRAPNILRFGFAPLYTRFVDVWDAADRLSAVIERDEWRRPDAQVRAAVT